MNVRLFLTLSSVILLAWLTTSYFSSVPVEGTLSQKPVQDDSNEVAAFISSDDTLVTAH